MNHCLRHLISAIAYRFARAVAGCSDGYAHFETGQGVRTPLEILHHMRGVAHYACHMVTDEKMNLATTDTWTEEKELFFQTLEVLDQLLEKRQLSEEASNRIAQGPLADILTHVGQLAMINRLDGNPVSKENYSRAEIRTGKIRGYQ